MASRPMSIQLLECIGAALDTKSGAAFPICGRVASVTPPETSVQALSPIIPRALGKSSRLKLSSIITSASASKTGCICEILSTFALCNADGFGKHISVNCSGGR